MSAAMFRASGSPSSTSAPALHTGQRSKCVRIRPPSSRSAVVTPRAYASHSHGSARAALVAARPQQGAANVLACRGTASALGRGSASSFLAGKTALAAPPAPSTSGSGSFAPARGARGGRRAASGAGAGASSRRVVVSVEANNLFSRVFRIVTSFFSNLVASAEDPEKLLDRVVEEMQDDMVRMRQASAQVTASQRQLQSKHRSLQANADQWLQRAELAVARGQDDLAREALRRRKVLQEDADRLLQQVQLQSQAAEQLQANIRFLEGKLGEARSKKETLKARAASARTSQQIQEMIGGLRSSTGSSWAAFDKMEEKVAALEAQAEAAAALSAPDSLEKQFVALEGDRGVEAELAALKGGTKLLTRQATGVQPSAAQPTAASGGQRRMSDVFGPLEVDAELEELRRRARQ